MEVQLYLDSVDVHQIECTKILVRQLLDVARNFPSFSLWCMFCFFLIKFFILVNFPRKVNINIF